LRRSTTLAGATGAALALALAASLARGAPGAPTPVQIDSATSPGDGVLGPAPPSTPAVPLAPGESFEPLHAPREELGEYLEGDAPFDRLAPDLRAELDREAAGFRLSADVELPVPEGYSLGFDHYASPAQIAAFLRELEEDYPDLVEVFTIGESWHGRPILAARVTNERAAAPLDARPAMYIDGQHHARELIGMQAALYTLFYLVNRYEHDPLVARLVDTRVAYFVPSVNVDGNHVVLNHNQDWRKTANPACCDDDGDDKVDEDAPVGYGYGTHSVDRYSFDEAWADAHPDDPFAPGWRDHHLSTERLGYFDGALGGPARAIAALDHDADGRTWEDPVGGVDANRNYDWLWEDGDRTVRSPTYRGPSPFSEPGPAAVRHFVSQMPNLAVAVSYHSGIDTILTPWGYSPEAELPDQEWFEILGRKGSQLTEVHGMRGSPHVWTARGLYGASGSTMDWLYGSRGVFALSPEVYGAGGLTGVRRVGTTAAFDVGQSVAFAFNPAPSDIALHADRWNRFATYLLAAVPHVQLASVETGSEEDGVRLEFCNGGLLPVHLELELGDGAATVIEGLENGSSTWLIPASEIPDGRTEMEMRVVLAIGTVPHVVQQGVWTVERVDGAGEVGLTIVEGEVLPCADLGARFGGWFAGDDWATRDYTCLAGRRTCPPEIPVTPRPTATAGPTRTLAPAGGLAWATPVPRPTRTPWKIEAPPWIDPDRTLDPPPTASATATATAPAATRPSGDNYLPFARR